MNYKVFVFGIFCLGILAITSCSSDFLDQESSDQLTNDNYWRNESDALEGLAAVYSQLEHFSGWDNYIEARSVREYYRSDYVKPGADAYNYDWWMELYNFNFTFGNYAIGLQWRDNYRGINYANQVIEKVGEMTEEQINPESQKEIIAEARFLRAWYYLDLIKNFEQVVLRDKIPTSEDLEQGLATRNEAWDFILEDLIKAEVDLPKRSQRAPTELGRATKGAAQAYLGRVYMYLTGEPDYPNADANQKAIEWLQKVVDSGEYSLESNFLGMFNGTKANSPESIFELQQSNSTENGAYYKSYLSAWVGAAEINGYGEIYATQSLVDEMKGEGKIAEGDLYDHRIYQTIYFNDDYFNGNEGDVYGNTYAEVFGENANTIAFRKWLPEDGSRIQQANAINMPLMRYADVLLLLAEALNNQGDPDAINYINQVRTIHGKLPELNISGQEAIFEQIVHERTMEFTLEGHRFFDLRRWGMLEEVMQQAGRNFSMSKIFFPIPQDEVHYNPGIE